jgi:hypothetical protein
MHRVFFEKILCHYGVEYSIAQVFESLIIEIIEGFAFISIGRFVREGSFVEMKITRYKSENFGQFPCESPVLRKIIIVNPSYHKLRKYIKLLKKKAVKTRMADTGSAIQRNNFNPYIF